MNKKLVRLIGLTALFPLFTAAPGCHTLPGPDLIAPPAHAGGSPAQASLPRERGEGADPAIIQTSALVQPVSTETIPPSLADYSIDLETALGLAGADNPTIALAQEAVAASRAQQLEAQSLLLPSLNVGVSYNDHQGPLQTSTGVITKVTRQSLYDGLGAEAVGAGTVGFPGVHLFADLADAAFAPRAARERVAGRSFDALATRNTILLEAATRYFDLAAAAASLQAARQSEADSEQIASLTSAFAKKGQGRQSDAERAHDNTLLLHGAEQRAEEDAAVAAAALRGCWTWTPPCAYTLPTARRPSYSLWTR